MQNSPQFMIYYYAVLHAAAVFVPINPMSKKLEVVFIQNATDARIFLSGSEVCEYFFPLLVSEKLEQIIVANGTAMADPNFDLKIPAYFAEEKSNFILSMAAICDVI